MAISRFVSFLANPVSVSRTAKWLVVGLAIAVGLIHAAEVSLLTPTNHLDGSFQTASGLFRLDAGQLPGRDFFPYLGVGPLLVLFPVFKVGGATLGASLIASNFACFVLLWLAITIVWLLLTNTKSKLNALVLGAVMTLVVPYLATWPGLEILNFPLTPGNSLKPIRSAAPYLAAGAAYFIFSSKFSGRTRALAVGSVAGLALLWSNDFALPTAGLLIVLFAVQTMRIERSRLWPRVLVMLGSLFVTYVLLITAITAGYVLNLWHYNFIDVAGDQWWYFGPYGSTARVTSPSELVRLIPLAGYFPLLVLMCVTVLVFVRRPFLRSFTYLAYIGFALFLGGTVACLGGHAGLDYYWPFQLWACLVTVLSILSVVKWGVDVPRNSSWGLTTSGMFVALSLTTAIIVLISGIQTFRSRSTWLAQSPDYMFVDRLGGYLTNDWREYLELAAAGTGGVTTEEYWGLWSSYTRTFPAWKVDSVIHALGDVREDARRALASSRRVITTRASYSYDWQPWSVSQNFWLYDELLSGWEPVFMSPKTIVWEKSDKGRFFSEVPCNPSAEGNSVEIEAPNAGFFRLTVEYSASNRYRNLLLFRNYISHPMDAVGLVSVDPRKTIATFPVYADMKGTLSLDTISRGESDSPAQVIRCNAESIPFSNPEVLHPWDAKDFYLTDQRWLRGISREFPGFFVLNTQGNRAKYRVGAKVHFGNGETRVITATSSIEPYLNIFVSGDVLDASAVGLPSEFTVDSAP